LDVRQRIEERHRRQDGRQQDEHERDSVDPDGVGNAERRDPVRLLDELEPAGGDVEPRPEGDRQRELGERGGEREDLRLPRAALRKEEEE
jgi:hypothetical protein